MKTTMTRHLLTAVLVAAALQASAARGGMTYHLTTLGSNFTPSAINSAGEIAGTVVNLSLPNAATYYNGSVTDLGTLGGLDSSAIGINNSGQVVGSAGDESGHGNAFFYSNGSMSNLGTLGGNFGAADGINSSGQVVGYTGTSNYSSNNSQIINAFLYNNPPNGGMIDLGALGGNYSIATAINDNGLIIGSAGISNYGGPGSNPQYIHAFLYNSGAMTDLGTLGGQSSGATAINDAGLIVGDAENASGNSHAFLYASGMMLDLGTLGGLASSAYDINNNGLIVGDSLTSGGSDDAFLYENGTMLDLNQLLDSSGAGWVLNNAYAINDNGWIVGAGNNGGFLLTPDSTTPEPSSAALCVLAACGAGLYRWKPGGLRLARRAAGSRCRSGSDG